MKTLMILALAISMFGCAARKPVNAQIIVPRECLVSTELGEKSECRGADLQHLHCYNMVITKKANCERIQVNAEKK